MGDGNACRHICVVHDDPLVDQQARPMGAAMEVIEEEGRDLLARDPSPLGEGESLGQCFVVEIGIELIRFGKCHGDDQG